MGKYVIGLVSLALFFTRSQAQSIDSVGKISIVYNLGNDILTKEHHYAKREIFEFVKESSGQFKLAASLLINYSVKKDEGLVTIDTTIIQFQKTKLPSAYFQSLVNALNTPIDNFNAAFIKPLLRKPSKKEVRRIAEEYLIGDYKKTYHSIRKFKYLDSFLVIIKPSIKTRNLVADRYNEAIISVETVTGRTTTFTLNFIHMLEQPFVVGQPVIKSNSDISTQPIGFINLRVNKILMQLLPPKSILRLKIDVSRMTAWYIEWYYEREASNLNY